MSDLDVTSVPGTDGAVRSIVPELRLCGVERTARSVLRTDTVRTRTRAWAASLFVLGLAFTAQVNGAEGPKKWKLALKRAMVDEWQPLFGIDPLRPARPAETWAQKMVVVQRLIVKSTGVHVPIYLSPELASTELPAIEQQEGDGVPIRHAAVGEVIRFLANTGGLRVTETDSGILLELAAAKAR